LGRVGHADGSAEGSGCELFGIVALLAEFVAWLVGGCLVFFSWWRSIRGWFWVLWVGQRGVCSACLLEA
jgi:hypothetical protein